VELVQISVRKVAKAAHARIVDQNVNTSIEKPQGLRCGIARRINRRQVAHHNLGKVGGGAQGVGSRIAAALGSLLQGLTGPREQHNPDAFFCKSEGNCTADAAARPGNDRSAASDRTRRHRVGVEKLEKSQEKKKEKKKKKKSFALKVKKDK
jgi:hypothetical protein